MNRLYYGDNLIVLRNEIAAESVDLIYLDPPFNSQRNYNLLFKSPKSGAMSEAQIQAFKDSWQWDLQAEREYTEVLRQPNTNVAKMMRALCEFLGRNDMTAYLTMMAGRLLELHRVLKPAGSLYLHCDPMASHYLKMLLDAVFGKENFRNEIIWKRTSGHSDAKGYGSAHDTLLFYARAAEFHWNEVFQPYEPAYVEQYYRYADANGRRFMSGDLGAAGLTGGGYEYEWKGVRRVWRCPVETMRRWDAEGRIFYTKNNFPRLKRYLDEAKGIPAQDLWCDVESLRSWHAERLGYPTQKPLALLERIINASSNKGDVVLDPFCGCGTAVHAAQKLKRKWIGMDITCLAISLIEKRLKNAFPRLQFDVLGTPKDIESARDLARRDKYQFQWWAVSLVEAQPSQGKKKGADGGVDGIKFFRDVDAKDTHKIVVSVKGGASLKASDIREIMAVREREGAEIALLISIAEPTPAMRADAASAGFYESATGKKYPRVQLLSIADLLEKRARAGHPDYEPDLNYKRAGEEDDSGEQLVMEDV